jgi:hypothetical protein
VAKAEEYLAAAAESLEARRPIAATSLAIHSAINAADAVTGARLGTRAAGRDHDEALSLLSQAGADGAEVARHLARLLLLKTKAEYESDEIPASAAEKAVERARNCVAVARRVVAPRS